MASRKRRKKNQLEAQGCLVLVAVCAVLTLLRLVAGEIAANPLVALMLATAVGAGGWSAIRAKRRGRMARAQRAALFRTDLPTIDQAGWLALEHTVAALLDRDGLAAEHIGQSNDQGVDVLGTDGAGTRIAFQCKFTTVGSNVGAPVLYKINGTAASCYGAHLSVVVTNGGFTRPAQEWGADPRHRVLLLDRTALDRWGRGYTLFELLGLPAAPLHPASSAGIAQLAPTPGRPTWLYGGRP